jgi:hypothetical protein
MNLTAKEALSHCQSAHQHNKRIGHQNDKQYTQIKDTIWQYVMEQKFGLFYPEPITMENLQKLNGEEFIIKIFPGQGAFITWNIKAYVAMDPFEPAVTDSTEEMMNSYLQQSLF